MTLVSRRRYWPNRATVLISSLLSVAGCQDISSAAADSKAPQIVNNARIKAASLATRGIFGRDTRTRIPAAQRNLGRSTGYLQFQEGNRLFRCSLFCVAEDVVATAAHCFFDPNFSTSSIFSNSVMYVGEGNDRKSAHINGRSTYERRFSVFSGCSQKSCKHGEGSLPQGHGRKDWALIKLDTDVCRGREFQVEPSDVTHYNAELLRSARLLAVGYPGDRSYTRATISTDCSDQGNTAYIDSIEKYKLNFMHLDMILNRCDQSSGMSGAPLLMTSETPDLKVIGIISSSGAITVGQRFDPREELRFQTIESNFATPATAFVRQIPMLQSDFQPPGAQDLVALQKALAALGYDPGPVDGFFGPSTRQAIIDFENATGMLPTGRPRLQYVHAARLLERIGREGATAYFSYSHDIKNRQVHFRLEDYTQDKWTIKATSSLDAATDFKAFAIASAPNAYGSASLAATPDQAVEWALAECNRRLPASDAATSGQAIECGLFALGDTIVEGATAERLAAMKLDYAYRLLKEAFAGFSHYRDWSGGKALAVDLSSLVAIPVTEKDTDATAASEALQKCNDLRLFPLKCVIFARGNEVVFNPHTPPAPG